MAYVGESANVRSRINSHLENEKRAQLNQITIIGSDRFNKSATLDIEARLIQYLSGESYYKLQNANGGLQYHNYYQRSLYSGLFREIWEKLRKEDLVKHSIEDIENSDIFKYSPYKALSSDQRESITEILQSLADQKGFPVFVSGGAGTGKTILATYLMKALASGLPDADEVEDFSESSLSEYQMLKRLKAVNPSPRIGLVVPMASLRKTLKNVFKEISGLKPSMVIGPSDVFKQYYDIVLVDEAHRLMRRKNITAYKPFDQNNRSLGLGNEGTQLDWILRQTGQQVFFYDPGQSVKPSDIPRERFAELMADRPMIHLKS
ncbi:MAG: DUF2075 domain-containing protein, partial [Opitutales bacterium]|nr:DUF2075 domain-containing protein [Opitutales bacterium]